MPLNVCLLCRVLKVNFKKVVLLKVDIIVLVLAAMA